MPVRLLDLVDVGEGGAGEIRGDDRRQGMPGGDGGDDGPQSHLVIALGALGGAGVPEIRAAGSDGELVRGARVLQLVHHRGAAISQRIAPTDGNLAGGVRRRDGEQAVVVREDELQLTRLQPAPVREGEGVSGLRSCRGRRVTRCRT